MQDRICLITGANSGIGKATAVALAQQGATIVMVCRDKTRGEAARRDIVEKSGNKAVDLLIADLSSQDSIRNLSVEFHAKYDALHVLVNNAGAAFGRRRESVDGIEQTFALNHLGYFLVTDLLLDLIKRSAPARVVNVASDAHRGISLELHDLQLIQNYSLYKAYAASKLANILFTYELDRRLNKKADSGVMVNALHPGVVRTNIWGGVLPLVGPIIKLIGRFTMLTPEEGAATSIYLASSVDVETVSGKYFVDCKPVRSSKDSYDEEVAKRLWEISQALCS
ncbi:MAG: SDR family oxidoreductase [Chloroflexota bacterium]